MAEKETNNLDLKALANRIEVIESLFSATLRLAGESIAHVTEGNAKYQKMYDDLMKKLDANLKEKSHDKK